MGTYENEARKSAGFCNITEATRYAMENLGLKKGEFKVLKGQG